MKMLLIGGNGQVGHALLGRLAPLGHVVATTRSGRLPDGSPCLAADVADTEALARLVAQEAPDLVINASAYTAVDRAQEEPELAHRINAQAPGALAGACARAGIGLVHFSTDYVFDGTATRPYREDDAVAPLGVYGASKWAGEQAVRDSGAAHKIFRLCWVYGPRGGNFLLTMLRLGRERDHLRVVSDQVGAPTCAARIANGVAKAITAQPALSGTWHLSAEGETSWHGFAQAIFQGAVERGLLSQAPRLEAISTDQFPTPARRPAYSRLDTSRFQRDFGLHIGDWREGLDEVLDALAALSRGP
ncbi:MAG: dTDP-4-dehydrorhamnose reductase [Arenimonas sp.]|uniref:dTDP-4-dehydrorhamnose reductase n=1 Tax=Arenimonas sp. TaxID=1872635 RepID=UPI0025BAD799|nr:dTDP-4-dehydrorhamnose reductase [Arenimonas sp.]MBW8368455.1 dTDP-4-dehydrorhamnose reductase [Arenimonas sp.]